MKPSVTTAVVACDHAQFGISIEKKNVEINRCVSGLSNAGVYGSINDVLLMCKGRYCVYWLTGTHIWIINNVKSDTCAYFGRPIQKVYCEKRLILQQKPAGQAPQLSTV